MVTAAVKRARRTLCASAREHASVHLWCGLRTWWQPGRRAAGRCMIEKKIAECAQRPKIKRKSSQSDVQSLVFA